MYGAMKNFRRAILSLFLVVTMALLGLEAAFASAAPPCPDMAGMTMAGDLGKGEPGPSKTSDCSAKPGCILVCAKLNEPMTYSCRVTWSSSSFVLGVLLIPDTVRIKPDHSPPKSIV